MVNISKVDGVCRGLIAWAKVVEAGKAFGVNTFASQVGPSSTDAPQQVKIIEDLIARKVNAITISTKRCQRAGTGIQKRGCRIVVLTNESPVSQVLTGILKSLITKNLLNMLSI